MKKLYRPNAAGGAVMKRLYGPMRLGLRLGVWS